MRDMLIRTDDDDATLRAINPANGKYVFASLQIRAEYLFVVAQAEPALSGSQ